MYNDRKERHDSKRQMRLSAQKAYGLMIREGPQESAIEAFRRKPYEIGGVHNGLDGQGTEEGKG